MCIRDRIKDDPERLLEARSSKNVLAALQRVFVNKTEKKKEKKNRQYRLIIVAEAVQRAMLAGRQVAWGGSAVISEWVGGMTVFWDRKRLVICLLQPWNDAGNRGRCQINAFLNDDTLNIFALHLYSR